MSQKNPYLTFRFLVEIQGLVAAGFSEVSGLSAETDFDSVEEGGVNEYVHKLPGRTKYPNLVLKRGLVDSTALWNWYHDVVTGKITRRSGAIILLDSVGDEKWRWNFKDAYPVKWIGPELKADANTVAVETLELAHNGLEKG